MSNSEKPVTFTEQEQLQLNSLDANARILQNINALLNVGTFPGDKASALLEGQRFIQGVLQNTLKQADQVKQSAQERASAPVAAEEATNG